MIKNMYSRFRKYVPFMLELVKRDFKIKYKRSILGVLWSVLQPLMTMIVLTIVFSTLFRFNIENYPLYLISGQIIFNFFNEATTMSMSAITANATFVNKVYVPLYILPLSRVLSSLINVFLSLIALIIVVFLTGAVPTLTILLVPLPFIYTFLFSCGVSMLLSAGSVFFKDLTYLYGIITTVIMYLTPIFYPESILPEKFMPFFLLNPILHFVRMIRNVILYNTVPTLSDHLICFAFCFLSLLVGVLFFHKKKKKFILHV